MRKVKVSMVLQSHLSDAMVEVNFNTELATSRLRFVKALLHKYPDTNQEISVDELNKLWSTTCESGS